MKKTSTLLTSRSSAFPAVAAHDAISTSSSTLVNPDLDDDVSRRRRQYLAANPQHTSNAESAVMHSKKRGPFTTDGWLKGEAQRMFVRSKEEYPDDHRCSDQETASGLCGCTQENASPESTSSNSPAVMSEQENVLPMGAENNLNYDQQLLAARKRKLMSSRRSKSLDDETVKRPTLKTLGLRNHATRDQSSTLDQSTNQSRDLLSDPVLVQRPSFTRHPASFSYNDQRRKASSSEESENVSADLIPNRRWASSPIQPASHGKSRQMLSSRVIKDRASAAPYTSQKIAEKYEGHEKPLSSTSAPPSAARKSISSVFEKLLKEEEERREEERAKKEAARERRREAKRRKEAEWPQNWDKKDNSLPKTSERSEDRSLGVDEDDEKGRMSSSMLESHGLSRDRVLQEASRLQRLSHSNSFSSPVQEIAPKPSPQKPSAESYKEKLAALRSASVEESDGDGDLTMSVPLQVRTPASDHSLSEHLQEEDSKQEDQVTMGSDFQGQAPLHSTPPRSSPSIKSKTLLDRPVETIKAREVTSVEDSLKHTLQQLTAALHEVRGIKADPSVSTEISLVELNRPEEGRILIRQPAINTLEERRKQTTEIDKVYVEKLGSIRKRIQKVTTKSTTKRDNEKPARSSRFWSLLITLLIQLLFAWLMMTAAEARARQLFLTSYYDPFLPHDIMDFSTIHRGNLFEPLLRRWRLLPIKEFFGEDSMTLANQNWSDTFGWAARHVIHGQDKGSATKLLAVRISKLLGLDGNDDVYSIRGFVPT